MLTSEMCSVNLEQLCCSSPEFKQQTIDYALSNLHAIRIILGLVGVNFDVASLRTDGQVNSYTSLHILINHICYLLDYLGENNIGLGSDFNGCVLPNDLSDVSAMPRLIETMQKRYFSDALIQKICQDNWLNILNHIWHKNKS